MVPMALLIVVCMTILLVLRINTQQTALFKAVDARSNTLAGSMVKTFSDALYSEDYETIISHSLTILAANQDMESIVVRSEQDVLVFRDGSYEFLTPDDPSVQNTALRIYTVNRKLEKDGIDLGSLELTTKLDDFDQQITSMYKMSFFEVATCVLLVLSACWLIAGRLTQPIRALEQVMSRMAAGERTARAEVVSADEIGSMATAFNSMLDVLQSTEQSLVEANQTLESRVRERTIELYQANDKMAIEIEHRKEIEASLRLSEERYDLAVNGVNDGIWDWDLEANPEGNQIYQSGRFKQLLGYDPDEILEPYTQWIHPDDLPSFQDAVGRHLAGNSDGLDIEYRALTRSGECRWYRSRGRCIRDYGGKAVRMAGSLTDITSQRKTDQKMAELHREMLAMSRQAGMAEVASGVLHNVGNVLNSVCVSAATVSETLESSRTQQLTQIASMVTDHTDDLADFLTKDDRGKRIPRYLVTLAETLSTERSISIEQIARISEKLEHIKEIVSRQQEYARVGGVEEELILKDVFEDAIRINQAGFDRHGIELIRDFEDVPVILTDKHKLLQILVNLLSNAKSAVSEVAGDQKRVIVRLRLENRCVSMTIIDNGIGIAKEHAKSIFAHGFTTKKDGHGFGLHSCALAADDLGGGIGFESEGVGLGAAFTLTLPLTERFAEATA